jgi:hypothetical protein
VNRRRPSFTREQQHEINELITLRLERQKRVLATEHTRDVERLRRAFDELVKINTVLEGALTSLEAENVDLRTRLIELSAKRTSHRRSVAVK